MSMTEDELLPETLRKLGLRPDTEVRPAQRASSIEEVFPASGSSSSGGSRAPPGNRLQVNPFYGKDLHMFQPTSTITRTSEVDEDKPRAAVATNNILIPSNSLVNNSLRPEAKQQNNWLFLFKDTPSSTMHRPTCGYCRPYGETAATTSSASVCAQQPTTAAEAPIEEVPNCNCANNKNLFRRKENALDEIFHRKKTLFRTCLEKADRKWTFFNAKPSHVIINRRFKSNLRSSLLREPILKLNKLEIEFREDTLTRRLTFSEIQTRCRASRPPRTSEEVFDLQLLDPQRILLEESKSRLLPICESVEGASASSAAGAVASSSSGTTGSVQQQQQLATCSQQAARLNNCDVTIDELASYFETFVHIPKKMSSMAEMMYT